MPDRKPVMQVRLEMDERGEIALERAAEQNNCTIADVIAMSLSFDIMAGEAAIPNLVVANPTRGVTSQWQLGQDDVVLRSLSIGARTSVGPMSVRIGTAPHADRREYRVVKRYEQVDIWESIYADDEDHAIELAQLREEDPDDVDTDGDEWEAEEVVAPRVIEPSNSPEDAVAPEPIVFDPGPLPGVLFATETDGVPIKPGATKFIKLDPDAPSVAADNLSGKWAEAAREVATRYDNPNVLPSAYVHIPEPESARDADIVCVKASREDDDAILDMFMSNEDLICTRREARAIMSWIRDSLAGMPEGALVKDIRFTAFLDGECEDM